MSPKPSTTPLYTATASEHGQKEEVIGRSPDLNELREDIRRQAQRDWQASDPEQRSGSFPATLKDLETLPVEQNTEFTDEGDPIMESYRMGKRRYDIGQG